MGKMVRLQKKITLESFGFQFPKNSTDKHILIQIP